MKEKDYHDIFAEFKGLQTDLIPILVRIQDKQGYISEESVRHVSSFMKMSENQIYGVASFYPKFRFNKPGKKSIKVCMGTACHVRGGLFLSEAVGWKLGIGMGQTTEDKRFDFQRAGCLGCCTLAPVVKINDDVHSRMSVTQLKEILEKDE